MKSIGTFIPGSQSYVALVTVLFDAHAALAIDGAAQTESFIKNIVKTLVKSRWSGSSSLYRNWWLSLHYEIKAIEKLDKTKTLLYSGLGLVIINTHIRLSIS